ncbi:MAG TPA: NAD(P)/FAD-dependent oxidoreductase [Myxococcota bacterium]|nr:NAD(P)/FAD-dependent oxidoreductase [Myxococcota bacterium]
MDADIIIVGAGPSGCATAMGLADRGLEVLVLDRAAFPRDKVCGEGLMPHGVAALEALGLRERLVQAGAQPFFGIAYHDGARRAEGRFPEVQGFDHGLALRRLHMDPIFQEAAASRAEVRLHTEVEVTGFHVEEDGVRVESAMGTLEARALVGADGLNSMIRRKLGLRMSPAGRPRYGARLHLQLAAGRAGPELVEVHLGEGSEVYLTPVGEGLVNLAFLCEKEVSATLGGDLEGGLLRLAGDCASLETWLEGSEVISEAMLTGPLRQTVKDIVSDRTLLVGDAAGFLDPITGEGLSVALAHAGLAARVLAEALPDGATEALLRPYAEGLAVALKDPLRLTELILWWVHQPMLRGYVVENLARNPEVFSTLLAVLAGSATVSEVALADLRKLVLRY